MTQKDITKNITNHYQRVIGGDLEKMHIEEWDMDIYYRKTNTFQDEAKVIDLQAKGKIVEALVESVIQKARDKDGKKLFQPAHKTTLMNEADPAVVTKIATAINNAVVQIEQEDVIKESVPTSN